MGPLVGAQQAIFNACLHDYRAKAVVGVDHEHATNNFCIAPRLAESGAHSMDSFIFKAFLHNCRAQTGVGGGSSARNKRLLYSASSCGIWRSQHGQFIFKAFLHNCKAQTGVGVDHQHATNDFCIAPRLAESGAHIMDSSFSRHFCIIAGPKRVWGWIISTQQTTFV